MGTTLQRLGLTEADYRGERFRGWKGKDLKGAIELLLLTKPEAVERVHEEYLRAGADVIETNTFSATTIGLHEFLFAGKPNNGRKDPDFFEQVVYDVGLRDTIREINSVAAGMAREAADRVGNETGEQRFVAGALGPLPVTASLSSDVNDPGFRAVTFDQIKQSYRDQIDALLAGGVDLLMVETIFDTLNAKAALFAILEASEKNPIPLVVSGTITDRSGRTLIGQTLETFLTSIAHANPLMVGLNCALGPDEMNSFIEELARVAPTFVSAYPNAGLPDPLSETGFPETPETFAPKVLQWARNGWLNMIGGCCGTTPAHIAAFAKQARDLPPRKIPTSLVDSWAKERSSAGAPKTAREARTLPREETILQVEGADSDSPAKGETSQANERNEYSERDAAVPGSARASPETSGDIRYSKRCLPHFERPWGKYAVAFSTHERQKLTPEERDIVMRSALHGHEHGQYELYVACVTPDYVHLLFEPQIKEETEKGESVFWSLPEILHGIKSSSAHRINKQRETAGPVWEKESFDRLIRSETDLQEKFLYICQNPWDSNVVVPNEDYPWLWAQERSSAGAPKKAREARALPREEAQAEVEETAEDADRPHEAQQIQPLHLSGLEPLNITRDFGFAVIGERTNITGSPKFSKLILAGDFEGAVAIARQQVANGANIIDVNVDEGMLDSEATMTRFLNLISSEPEIAG